MACVWISLLLLSLFIYLFIFFTKCVRISYACNVRNNPLLFLCQCYPILAPLPIDLRNWKSIIGFSIEKGKGVFFNHYIYTCCIKYFIVFYIRFGFKKCCTCARLLDLWIGGLLFRGRYLKILCTIGAVCVFPLIFKETWQVHICGCHNSHVYHVHCTCTNFNFCTWTWLNLI